MTKKEYAKSVANMVGGEVKDIEKANGIILTGIIVGDGTIRPTIYIDQMFEEGMDVEGCANIVKELADKADNAMPDFSRLQRYDLIKGDLRLRLFNESTRADVFMSAASHGFPDMILIPYLENVVKGGSMRITKSIMEMWNVSKETLFNDAALAGEYEIVSFDKVLREFGDMEAFDEENVPQMLIVTNKLRCYGAYGVIALKDKIKEIFSDGYVVIPSSVHECIIVSSTCGDIETINGMVREVNDQLVEPEEVLGNRAYEFL